MHFLDSLSDMLFPPRAHEQTVRSYPLNKLGVLTEPREIIPQVVSLLPYEHPFISACIQEAKFHRNPHAEMLLGSLLADFLIEMVYEYSGIYTRHIQLIPLPLSRQRLKERGYSQTDRVARCALRQVPAIARNSSILTRTRHTLPQTSLGRYERFQNVVGAFSVSEEPYPAHLYIVFDDVFTTGATIQAAMKALRKAGAVHVFGLTLAHAS